MCISIVLPRFRLMRKSSERKLHLCTQYTLAVAIGLPDSAVYQYLSCLFLSGTTTTKLITALLARCKFVRVCIGAQTNFGTCVRKITYVLVRMSISSEFVCLRHKLNSPTSDKFARTHISIGRSLLLFIHSS